MKERPILYTGEMVRAILEGRKTKTRRVINKLLGFGMIAELQQSHTIGYDFTIRDSRKLWNDITYKELLKICPYGQVGDHLWVRETWRPFYDPYWLTSIQYKADMGVVKPDQWETESAQFGMWCEENTGDIPGEGDRRWHPSIYLPRCFARITLEITNISVERVQDISEEDAIAEGCLLPKGYEELCKLAGGHRAVFRDLWDSINAKRGFGWDSNPLVWVISFKLIERNNDAERTV